MCVLLWLKRVAIKKEKVMVKKSNSDICVCDVSEHGEDISRCFADGGWYREWWNDTYGVLLAVVDGGMVDEGGSMVWGRYDIRSGGKKGNGRRMSSSRAYGVVRETRACTVACWRDATEEEPEVRRRCVLVVVNNRDIGVGSIAHEANHAADLICDTHGVRYGLFEIGEAHAYLTGWVASRIAYALRRFIDQDRERKVERMAVDAAFLKQWYIDSVDSSDEPLWTDKHIEELCKDFHIIKKLDDNNSKKE